MTFRKLLSCLRLRPLHSTTMLFLAVVFGLPSAVLADETGQPAPEAQHHSALPAAVHTTTAPVPVRLDARTAGLMHFIGALEAPGGYDDYYHGVRLPPPKPLTTMTVNEVLAWQQAAGRVSLSSAAGRYQIIGSTLKKLKGELGLTGQETFDKTTQDRLAVQLLKDAGWSPASKPSDAVGTALAAVWASLPILGGPAEGLSVYDGVAGNHALTSPKVFRQVLTNADDPKVVEAAIKASGKSTSNAFANPWSPQRYALVAAYMKMGMPVAFDASVIEGGRLAPGKVLVFKNDPFAVN
jgi:hypothetical protein